jgi:hypothetical protein
MATIHHVLLSIDIREALFAEYLILFESACFFTISSAFSCKSKSRVV